MKKKYLEFLPLYSNSVSLVTKTNVFFIIRLSEHACVNWLTLETTKEKKKTWFHVSSN